MTKNKKYKYMFLILLVIISGCVDKKVETTYIPNQTISPIETVIVSTPGPIHTPSPTTTIAPEKTKSSNIYRAFVDNDYGFYKVTNITPGAANNSAPYDKINTTLRISVGDTVIWENDASPDEPLTIVSNESLWNITNGRLRWNYQRFTYIFNETGMYRFYIKEYSREQHQTVIVE